MTNGPTDQHDSVANHDTYSDLPQVPLLGLQKLRQRMGDLEKRLVKHARSFSSHYPERASALDFKDAAAP